MLTQDDSLSLACRLLDGARSSYHYRPQAMDGTALKVIIEAVAAERPTYGYRGSSARQRGERMKL